MNREDVDKDPEILKDIAELENLANSIKHSADHCEMTDIFLDDLGNIGGLHRKYTRFTYLPRDSLSSKRFSDAITKARDAKITFINNCKCYKK